MIDIISVAAVPIEKVISINNEIITIKIKLFV